MYNIIQHSHSGIMWLVIAMLTVSVLISMLKFIKKCDKPKDYFAKLFNYTKWAIYIQALLGIALLFTSPLVKYESGFMKSEELRFYGMEHPLMMLIAIGFVAMGLFKTKKKTSSVQKNKTIFIFYAIALIVMLAMIPWKTVMS